MAEQENIPAEGLEYICIELNKLAYTPLILPQSEWYNGKFGIIVQTRDGQGESEDQDELEAFAKQHNLDFAISSRKLSDNVDDEKVVILRQWKEQLNKSEIRKSVNFL